VLQGLHGERVLANGHETTSVFGKASDIGRPRLMSVLRQMRADGYLRVEPEGGGLVLDDAAWPVLTGTGRVSVSGIAPRREVSVVRSAAAGLPAGLASATASLVEVRVSVAASEGVHPLDIMDDRTIERIVSAMPESLEELAAVQGVSPAVAGAHWEAFTAPFAGRRKPEPEVSDFSLF